MKAKVRISTLLISILTAFICADLIFLPANAEELIENTWKFTVEDDEATVTGYTGSARKLQIPDNL